MLQLIYVTKAELNIIKIADFLLVINKYIQQNIPISMILSLSSCRLLAVVVDSNVNCVHSVVVVRVF